MAVEPSCKVILQMIRDSQVQHERGSDKGAMVMLLLSNKKGNSEFVINSVWEPFCSELGSMDSHCLYATLDLL